MPDPIIAPSPGVPVGAGSRSDYRGPKEPFLDKAWKIDSATRLVASAVRSALPSHMGTISVVVQGGPQATMRRLWYLACAAAFGRLRNAPTGNFQQLDVSTIWAITDKLVKIDLTYSTNTLTQATNFLSANAGGSIGAVLGFGLGGPVGAAAGFAAGGFLQSALSSPSPPNPQGDAISYLHRGPEQLTIGDSWPDWLTRGGRPDPPGSPPDWAFFMKPVGAGLGGTALVSVVPRVYDATTPPNVFVEFPVYAGQYPVWFRYFEERPPLNKLPFTAAGRDTGAVVGVLTKPGKTPYLVDTGRVITTCEKNDPRVQPPRPPLDANSRGSLVSLVAAALASPGFLPVNPSRLDPGQQLSSAGLYAFGATGNPIDTATLARELQSKAQSQLGLGPTRPQTQIRMGGEVPATAPAVTQ